MCSYSNSRGTSCSCHAFRNFQIHGCLFSDPQLVSIMMLHWIATNLTDFQVCTKNFSASSSKIVWIWLFCEQNWRKTLGIRIDLDIVICSRTLFSPRQNSHSVPLHWPILDHNCRLLLWLYTGQRSSTSHSSSNKAPIPPKHCLNSLPAHRFHYHTGNILILLI